MMLDPDIKIQGETRMTRFLMTMALAVTCALAGANVAGATSDSLLPESGINKLNEPNLDLRQFTFPQMRNSSRSGQEPVGPLTVMAQIYGPVATGCYTFAGPVCPMREALPPGSACTCYYNDGWLAGTAW
jgi:hypothetical protein